MRNNDLQGQLDREKIQADELQIRSRMQMQQILDVEAAIAALNTQKKELDSMLQEAQEKSIVLRR